MMLDSGFNFGASRGGGLREKVMQLCETLSGSRFLRGVNRFGGVSVDMTEEDATLLDGELHRTSEEFNDMISLAEGSDTLYNRLQGTGKLSHELAESHDIVGVAARAVGMPVDTRHDYPYAAYAHKSLHLPDKVVRVDGDVYDRFEVRVQEVRGSLRIIQNTLEEIGDTGKTEDALSRDIALNLKPNSVAVSAVEGWRGEIIYLVLTDEKGQLSRVAPRDPSFMNWSVLGHAGAGNVVPDFPLINKSFNLSYTGNDL